MKPEKLSKDEIQRTLRDAVEAAVDFVDSEIAPERLRAAKALDGAVSIGEEEGRSKAVATKCRDTVRAVMPALMRVFLQSGKPVEFAPRSQETVAEAEQRTSYAQYVFEQNGGFQVLYDAFMDALVRKTGIVKVWFEDETEVEFDNYSGLTGDQYAFLSSDPEVEVIGAEQGEDGLWEVKVSRQDQSGRIAFASVKPEDFFIDSQATSIRDYTVCGHREQGHVGDLVAMGFDFKEVYDLSDRDVSEEEDVERVGAYENSDEEGADKSMRPVLITEAYMKMDIEGTGVATRYKFICAGSNYEILDYEPCDHLPFAVFEVDPEPHAFHGKSLVDIIIDDQDVATSLLRGLLDGVQLMNNPRIAIDQNTVNTEDVLNNEIGGVIRTKGPPGMSLQEITMGMAATAALPALMHHDQVVRGKTGVSNVSMGLNADALSSHETKAGVDAAMQAEGAVVELMARVLAEGGMRQLFEIISELARANPQRDEMMQIDGRFVPVDPRSWTGKMGVVANVGLGTGQKGERIMALNQTLGVQQQIWQAFGPGNGLVTMTGIRNTLADMLKLGGVHNADRYYEPMDPEREQQLLQEAQQRAQQQQQGSDPNQAFIQVEQMKAQARAQEGQAKMQLEGQKAMAEHQRRMREDAARDDLARDRMAQEMALEAARIQGQHQLQVDQNMIRREQAMPRNY